MELNELINIISPQLPSTGLDDRQMDVVRYGDGPLWVIAGPGSGKTETLIIRLLKLIFVDNINPKSIIITTFTEKAAKNMMDRISNYAALVYDRYPHLQHERDISELYIGTLHSLCNKIMLEYRYSDYENYRLMDELEQHLFIYEHSDAVNNPSNYGNMWNHFRYMNRWNRTIDSKWGRTSVATTLLNRLVEYRVDINRLNNGDQWAQELAQAYEDYLSKLERHRRCDFSHLQLKFLNFLDSDLGRLFINGDGSDRHPGIMHVLVDEYQDTNPIQEAIYFRLAQNTHNLTVVGDDDQALYRFRGGTVECMVNFDSACEREWGIRLTNRNRVYLNNNYRSHPEIVEYYDTYIKSFRFMTLPGARVPSKPNLNPRSGISGNHIAVGYISGRTIANTAENFAQFVRYLLDENIINRPSECVLLMKSVRETRNWARPFRIALENEGIEVYNPRSRTFLEQEEIMLALGAFVTIIDPNQTALRSITSDRIRNMVWGWINEYIHHASSELRTYVDRSIAEISTRSPNEYLNINISEILYHMFAHQPFREWIDNDPEKSYRLGQLTKIFENYSSIPLNQPGTSYLRGTLRMSSRGSGEISYRWRQNFYYSLVGLLSLEGLNDPENEEIITPPDRLPIMTIHQAKGLEFPFVFVYNLTLSPQPNQRNESILIEEDLSPYRVTTYPQRFNANQREEQDIIRLYYVAYSRAKYALIHLVPDVHLRRGGLGFIHRNVRMFQQVVQELRRDA